MNSMNSSKRGAADTGDNANKIPVMEESLQLNIRKEETGRLRATKQVHEEPLIVSGPVLDESVKVERVTLNQYIDEAPLPVRHEGDTMIIPVVKEELVVSTRLILVEEIRITRHQVESTVEKPITLRKEEVTISRVTGQEKH